MWAIIQNALREIHSKDASKLSFEQLYRASYKIVLKKQGDALYNKVKEFEEQWFATEVMPPLRSLITDNLVNITTTNSTTVNERLLTGQKFLNGLKRSWQDHHQCMNMATDVLMYMDRVYCQDNRRPSIFTTAMGLFRDHVLKSKMVEGESTLITFDLLSQVILDQIAMERAGDVIDKNLIRSCIYMLEGLYETDEENENEKLYLTTFEPQLLESSREFYAKECEDLLRNADTSSWLRQTQKRLTEEADRCRTTVSLLTDAKIAKVVEEEMISSHLQEFISLEGSGIHAMIDNDRLEDLKLAYQNISRVDDTKKALKDALSSRVITLGNDINNTITNTNFADDEKKLNAAAQQTVAAIKWVDDILILKDKFDTMWKRSFEEDQSIQSSLTKAFTEFINVFPRSSEYVSLFIDDNLKRGIKGKTEAEVDVVLDKATTLLRYLMDKDLFERYYKKHLAKRLLHGRSESSEVEKQMISRMKLEIGSYFTSKLEGMFKDMTLSEEMATGYRTHIQNLGAMDTKHIELNASVLTSNCWPMEAMGGAQRGDGINGDIAWPTEMKALQESFKKFYLQEKNGRKLTWLGHMGTADVRCTFPKVTGKEGPLAKERRYDINMPTYGMVVVLLFNDLESGQSLSIEEIQVRTQIPTGDLQKLLMTLAVIPKTKVLNKEPATKNIKPGDKFSFNDSFFSKAIKIKAPTISATNKVEGDEERKDTESRNDDMRAGVIEACIVRIMK